MRYLNVSCFILYLIFYLFKVLHTYSMMDVQALLQVGRIEPLRGGSSSSRRRPKPAHVYTRKGNSDVGRCQNSVYREEGIDGDGTGGSRV